MMVLLRFCPSCGVKLPQLSTVRYCSNCGENLADFTANETVQAEPLAVVPAGKPEPGNDQVKTYAEVVRRYDQLIADLQAQGLDEGEIRRQGAALFTRLKAQLPVRSAAFNSKRIAFAKPEIYARSEEHYSVVLKSSGNKERVTKRLSEVLRRGPVATRMAVDMVPCIILYKSKAKDMQEVTAIFQDEHLHYTVIKGEFDPDTSVEKTIPGFTGLTSELQLMLQNAPAMLWLGEQIQMIVSDVEREGEPGVLAVTDQALYIFSGLDDDRQADWQIIPYDRLAEVVIHDDQGGALELIYQGYGREEWLRSVNQEQLERVYEHVRLALARQKR
jgi:hypothetical protein